MSQVSVREEHKPHNDQLALTISFINKDDSRGPTFLALRMKAQVRTTGVPAGWMPCTYPAKVLHRGREEVCRKK